MADEVLMKDMSSFRLAVGYGDGAAAEADITITGIKAEDQIVFAFHVNTPAGTGKTFLANLNTEISITADDTVQCSTTDTSASNTQVLVGWVPKTA